MFSFLMHNQSSLKGFVDTIPGSITSTDGSGDPQLSRDDNFAAFLAVVAATALIEQQQQGAIDMEEMCESVGQESTETALTITQSHSDERQEPEEFMDEFTVHSEERQELEEFMDEFTADERSELEPPRRSTRVFSSGDLSQYTDDTYSALEREIEEQEEEIIYLDKQLKKYRKKNKNLTERVKNQRNEILAIEEEYANMKVELARAQANEDNLKIMTQEAIAERDLKILELSNQLDESQAEAKKLERESRKTEKKLAQTERMLQRKENKLQDVTCDRDALKKSVNAAKRLLKSQMKQSSTEEQRQDIEVLTKERKWGVLSRLPARRRTQQPRQKPDKTVVEQ